MVPPVDRELFRRRVLRLGALLFQLRYYQQAPYDGASTTFRAEDGAYVRLAGETVLLVGEGHEEALDLETAISRCKAAVRGEALLHRAPPDHEGTS
jgi:hypothetical protein